MSVRESVRIGDKVVTLETGRIAKQAGGAILATCGETVVLVTCCGTPEGKPGQSFLPLSVEYQEKTYAAGKIPGGFFKREGKLRDAEVLVSRLIDRPCRPLFPEGWFGEIQVIATVMSADKENPPDVVAMTAASAAIHLSQIPWAGPIAGVRVGRVDGRFVANPTVDEMAKSDMELVIAASKDAIVMVEGEADEISEEDMVAAIEFGKAAVQDVLALIDRMREAAGRAKWPHTPPTRPEALEARVREVALPGVREACNTREKHARYGKFKAAKKATIAQLAPEFPGLEKQLDEAYEELRYQTMRNQVVYDKTRVDGRDLITVRPISIEVGLLPRVHGSTLFTRGETQAIVTATLGTRSDEQKIDGLQEEYWKRFLLHYNFPPYSVGEIKPMRGPGRREVGHGNLAERALAKLLPDHEKFPYTIRIVSEITESNGSSSMASVCGGSLAMMDAGVPLRAPVAGVAMGLIMQGADYAVLTDILGDEDALGDMDFKVCGTSKGITAIQMDIKIEGLSFDIMRQALAQARDGRLHILGKMNEIITEGRPELSRHAPRITQVKVKPDQIRSIIGPGGKMIKAIQEQTGAKIDIADDGTVSIASADAEAVKKAIAIIESLTTTPEVGQKYKGIVKRVERYGAFVEIAPGTDGLVHITDMDWGYVQNVEDIAKLGDEMEVVVTNVDRDGKIRLSRKALLERPEGMPDVDEAPRGRRDDGERRPRRDDGERRPRRDDGERRPRRDDADRPRRDEAERPRRDEAERPRRDEAERVVARPVVVEEPEVRDAGRDAERDARRAERDARRAERDAERATRRSERDETRVDVVKEPVRDEAPRRERDERRPPRAAVAEERVVEAPRRERARDERRDEPREERRPAREDDRRPPREARDEAPRRDRGRDEVRDERVVEAPRRDRARDERRDEPREERRPAREARDEAPRRDRGRDEVRDDRRPARDVRDEAPRRGRDEVRDDRRPARDDDRRPARDDDRRPAREVRDEAPRRERGRDEVRDDRRPARDDDRRPARDDDRRPARDDDRRPARDDDRRPSRDRYAAEDDVLDVRSSPRREREDERPAPRRAEPRRDERAAEPARRPEPRRDDRTSEPPRRPDDRGDYRRTAPRIEREPLRRELPPRRDRLRDYDDED